MTTIEVPISEARTALSSLVKRVQMSKTRVCLTKYGKPKAIIIPVPTQITPWRLDTPDDPVRYGDLQSPVLVAWE